MSPRDADRTRAAILETAEELFARHGFAATSLQQIGEAAGYARSTPAYFFHSKQELYDAVLRQAFERGREAMQPAFAIAAEASAEQALDAIVGRFLDFLATDRNYVRLIQREALADEPSFAAVLDEELLADARRALAHVLGETDVDHVFLEIFALGWFAIAHAQTLVAALGFDAADPAFLRRHRERIVHLFTNLNRS
jgi:AcrR family transcriptional regulator